MGGLRCSHTDEQVKKSGAAEGEIARETRERTRKKDTENLRGIQRTMLAFSGWRGVACSSSGVATTEVHQSTFFLLPFRVFRGHPSPFLSR